MKLELYEKQLLRSISDLVVYNPVAAYDLFEKAGDSPIIDRIKNIKTFLVNNKERLPRSLSETMQHEQYVDELRIAIDSIEDKEVQKIFKSSLTTTEAHT